MLVRMLRFLALGDSYTIGEGVTEAERWPVQLGALLRERGIDVADPEIVATTGWTADELAAGIGETRLSGPYDLVSLLIGVNNQYRGGSVDGYREQFRNVLAEAIALAGGDPSHVIVLSVPDWGVTPFAEGRDRAEIAEPIDAFNVVNCEATRTAGARYVDITGISRSYPREVTSDSLHPTGQHYARWAELALAAAASALRG
jgi:lysophospholipase L1-like esterase